MKQLIVTIAICIASLNLHAQTKEQTRAKTGETVWVIVNVIKDSSKADYLNWMNTYFLPSISQSKDATIQKQYASTRWLEPKRQNANKTWTYVFIMDPVVPKANYDIGALLKTAFGETKGTELMQQYEAFQAADLISYNLVQTVH